MRPSAASRKAESEPGRRRVMSCRQRTHRHEKSRRRLRGQAQTSKRRRLHVLRPENERAATACEEFAPLTTGRPRSSAPLRALPARGKDRCNSVRGGPAWAGGCKNATRRLPATLSGGRRSRSSPPPAWCTSKSISAPTGQPPPGSPAECWITGVHDATTTSRKLGCAPNGRMYLFGEDEGGGHDKFEKLYIYTVWCSQIDGAELALLSELKRGCLRSQAAQSPRCPRWQCSLHIAPSIRRRRA